MARRKKITLVAVSVGERPEEEVSPVYGYYFRTPEGKVRKQLFGVESATMDVLYSHAATGSGVCDASIPVVPMKEE